MWVGPRIARALQHCTHIVTGTQALLAHQVAVNLASRRCRSELNQTMPSIAAGYGQQDGRWYGTSDFDNVQHCSWV
jgi:hypothetical protein